MPRFYHIPHGYAIAACFTTVLRAYLPFAADKLSELAVYCGFAKENAGEKENADAFIGRLDALLAELGIDGIWMAVNVAEVLAFILSAVLILCYRERYLGTR